MLPSMGNRFSNDVGMGGGGTGSVFAPNPRLQRGGPILQRPMPGLGGGGGASPVQSPVPTASPTQPVGAAPAQPGRSMFAPIGRAKVL